MSADDSLRPGSADKRALPPDDAGEHEPPAGPPAAGGAQATGADAKTAGSDAHDERGNALAADIEELFYEGSDLHGEGRYEEAMDRFDRCLAIDPNYADALLGKAMAHLERGEHEAAIALGNRIAERNPDDVLAYTSLSMFYERAGRIKEAEEAGAKARTLDWKRRLAAEPEK